MRSYLLLIAVVFCQIMQAQLCCDTSLYPPIPSFLEEEYQVICGHSSIDSSAVSWSESCGLAFTTLHTSLVPTEATYFSGIEPVIDSGDYWKGNLALWLPSGIEHFTYVPGSTAFYLHDEGATGHGILQSVEDATRLFRIHLYLDLNLSWAEWHALETIGPPMIEREYRANQGFVEDSLYYEDWRYLLVNESTTLIGEGSLEGSYLSLRHAPENLFFGVQLGEGATGLDSYAFGFDTWTLGTGKVDSLYGEFSADLNGVLDLQEYAEPSSLELHQAVWTAIDSCGNVAEQIQPVYVLPEWAAMDSGLIWSEPVQDLAIDCAMPQWTLPLAFSGCDLQDVNAVDLTGSSFCTDSLLMSYSATGLDGNSDTLWTWLTLVPDMVAPVLIDAPADTSLNCDIVDVPELIAPVFVDDCSDEIVLTYSDVVSGVDCDRLITRTYLASDACGNSTAFSYQISFQESTGVLTSVHSPLSIRSLEHGLYEILNGPIGIPFSVSFEVHDMKGHLVMPRTTEQRVDLRRYTPGFYLLTVYGEGGTILLRERIYR